MTVTSWKKENWIHFILFIIADKKHFTDTINAIEILKYYCYGSFWFLHCSCPLPESWARNSPVLAEACGREGFYYWTQEWLIIQTLGGGNEHQQALRFNIYPENGKRREMHITSPSLTGPTSHLHSDQTSEATKWKQHIDKRGLRKTASKKVHPAPTSLYVFNRTAVRYRKMGTSNFNWSRNHNINYILYNSKISQLKQWRITTAVRRCQWEEAYVHKFRQ